MCNEIRPVGSKQTVSLLSFSSLLIAGLVTVFGQKANDPEFKLRVHSELVLLDVSVKGSTGGYISDLKKENFQIYENGKLQTISQFGREDSPITVGLVLDDSHSMKPKRADVINSALAFIDSS